MSTLQQRRSVVRRLMMLSTILFIASFVQLIVLAGMPITRATIDNPELLSHEQKMLKGRYLTEHEELLSRIYTIQETGVKIYSLETGSYIERLPSWYQDGNIVLTFREQNMIADMFMTEAPWWMFWTDEAKVGEGRDLILLLLLVLTCIFFFVLTSLTALEGRISNRISNTVEA